MAKKASSNISVKISKPKKKRPNVHSKKKTSKLKGSKMYKKKYRSQGRNR